MARFISIDENGMSADFENALERIFDTELEQACLEGLNKAAPIVKKSMQGNLAGHGALGSKLHVVRAKKASNGALIAHVSFRGNVQSGWEKNKEMSARQAAFWLEYGTKRQPPRPFLDKSLNAVEGEVIKCIEAAHDKMVQSLGL